MLAQIARIGADPAVAGQPGQRPTNQSRSEEADGRSAWGHDAAFRHDLAAKPHNTSTPAILYTRPHRSLPYGSIKIMRPAGTSRVGCSDPILTR